MAFEPPELRTRCGCGDMKLTVSERYVKKTGMAATRGKEFAAICHNCGDTVAIIVDVSTVRKTKKGRTLPPKWSIIDGMKNTTEERGPDAG